MPKILKPGDPEFEHMKKELAELEGTKEIMNVIPSAGTEVTLEVRDFPDFRLEYGIVPMGELEDQIVFHFRKLSRIKMRALHEYLPRAIYEFFGGVNPAEHIRASESPLGEQFLEYRSQYDMVFYRVKTMNSRNVMNAVLQVIEAFPG